MNDMIRELVDHCDNNNYIIEGLNIDIPIAIVRGKNNTKVVLRYDERNQEWYWD